MCLLKVLQVNNLYIFADFLCILNCVAGTTPSLAVLTKLANYFGVTIDYLIGRNRLS